MNPEASSSVGSLSRIRGAPRRSADPHRSRGRTAGVRVLRNGVGCHAMEGEPAEDRVKSRLRFDNSSKSVAMIIDGMLVDMPRNHGSAAGIALASSCWASSIVLGASGPARSLTALIPDGLRCTSCLRDTSTRCTCRSSGPRCPRSTIHAQNRSDRLWALLVRCEVDDPVFDRGLGGFFDRNPSHGAAVSRRQETRLAAIANGVMANAISSLASSSVLGCASRLVSARRTSHGLGA